jgi:hypothetical protein
LGSVPPNTSYCVLHESPPGRHILTRPHFLRVVLTKTGSERAQSERDDVKAIVVLVLAVCATALVIAIGPEQAWCTLRGGTTSSILCARLSILAGVGESESRRAPDRNPYSRPPRSCTNRGVSFYMVPSRAEANLLYARLLRKRGATIVRKLAFKGRQLDTWGSGGECPL